MIEQTGETKCIIAGDLNANIKGKYKGGFRATYAPEINKLLSEFSFLQQRWTNRFKNGHGIGYTIADMVAIRNLKESKYECMYISVSSW